MLENQFIQFSKKDPSFDDCQELTLIQQDDTCFIPLPIVGRKEWAIRAVMPDDNTILLDTYSDESEGYIDYQLPATIADIKSCLYLRINQLDEHSYNLKKLVMQPCHYANYDEFFLQEIVEGGVPNGRYAIVIDEDTVMEGEWPEITTLDVDYDMTLIVNDFYRIPIKARNGELLRYFEFDIIDYDPEIVINIYAIDGRRPDGSHSRAVFYNKSGRPPMRLITFTGNNIYSNILYPAPADQHTATVKYRCNEDAFGFPFETMAFTPQVTVPIILSSPQFVQDDKTYIKANGEVVTLYAKYYKEWEGETEYLSAEMHEKIMAALSCDELFINGVRVTKSDNYQIDWENYTLACDEKTKLARATFKVREHITQRNSNY